MGRPIRKTVILFKLETTYGTDSVPTGGANALVVSNMTINPLVANNVGRDVVTGNLGSTEQLVGTAYRETSFDIEIAGSGTPTTEAAWGPLMRACGFSPSVGASFVSYSPISDISGISSTSGSIWYYLDGQLHKLLGARGTFSIEMGVGEKPVFRFRFIGLDGGLTAAANVTPTLTAWRTPLAVTDTNTGDLLFGAIYTAGTGVVSGGTAYPSRGLRLDIGNNVVFQPLLGSETVEIATREVTGQISLDLTAAQAVSFMTDVKANTLLALGFNHGTTSGNRVAIHAPAVQRINPGVEDLNGNALHTYQLRFVPVSGNDELRIITS